MTIHTWNAATGSWSTAGDWSDLQVPDARGDGVVIDAGGVYTVTVDAGATEQLATLLLNAAGATLAVAGTLNFAGGVSIEAGVLRTDAVAALTGAPDLTVASGATFDLNGYAQAIGGLAGAGTVLLEGSNLTLGGDNASTSFGGNVTGNNFNNAYLSKAGSGTLTLAGATIAGASLYLSAGSLAVATDSNSLSYLAIGEGTGNAASASVSGGTLALSNALQIGDFGGSGTLAQTGGTVALSYSLNIGNQGGSGVYNLAGGLLQLGNGALFDLGHNSSSHTASHGTLNLSGGQVDLVTGTFILGDLLNGGANAGSGTVVQTGGTFTVEAASGGLNLSAFGNGEYDLDGGILQVGGGNLIARWTGGGTSVFALGGGTVQVVGSTLTTSVAATLTATSAIDTNGLGASWSGALSGTGGLTKLGAGTLALTDVNSFGGDLELVAGTLELGVAGSAGSGQIVFADGAAATLRIDGATPSNVIAGFVAGDSIDLAGLAYGAGMTTSYDTPSGVLSILNAGSAVAALHFGAGNAAVTDPFHLALDTGGTGTVLTNDSVIPCFLRGTRIRTPRGDIAVEALRAGETVLTMSGDVRPIVWIGVGRAKLNARNRRNLAPVILRRDALAPGMPHRDLVVTRHHAVLVGDVLVPAQHLVNGVSVRWDNRADRIEYYHIELETHDLLLAEGAPVESFRDDCSATLFANAASRATRVVPPCREIVDAGAALAHAWRAVAVQAAPVPERITSGQADLHLRVHGQRIGAVLQPDGRLRFDLPPDAGDIAIVSHTTIPAAMGDGADLRRLGVAVLAMRVIGRDGCHSLPLDDDRLGDGFHALGDGHRWTNGWGVLPGDLLAGHDPVGLELRVAVAASYRITLTADHDNVARRLV